MERDSKAIEKAVERAPLKIWGKVRHGDKRGRTIGYPTVNIRLHRNVRSGVYAGYTAVNGKMYSSMILVGAAKTFGNTQMRVESHLFGFSKEIYGDMVQVYLVERTRNNKKFKWVPELVHALSKDALAAKAVCERISPEQAIELVKEHEAKKRAKKRAQKQKELKKIIS